MFCRARGWNRDVSEGFQLGPGQGHQDASGFKLKDIIVDRGVEKWAMCNVRWLSSPTHLGQLYWSCCGLAADMPLGQCYYG